MGEGDMEEKNKVIKLPEELQGSALDLANASVAPRIFKTGPPNYYTQTAFPKKIDVAANFTIDDSFLVTTATEKVPTSTGLIIWQPNRGAGSMYRFGIVPQGARVYNSGNVSAVTAQQSGTSTVAGATLPFNRGLTFPYIGNTAVATGVTSQGIATGCDYLTYQSPVAVPYNVTNNNDVIKQSPDLALSFSQTRLFSGDLRVICDSVPIGNTALNGVFACGAFSDTRDVSQVAEGTGQPTNCFDPNDLVQASVTSKDGLKEISAMKGIVSLVASDIQPFYAAPNIDETDVVNAGWETITPTSINTAAQLLTTVGTGTFGTYPVFCPCVVWVSPWNVQYTSGVSSAFNSSVVNNVNLGPINLNGVLDFRVNFSFFTHQLQNLQTFTALSGPTIEVNCNFTHVFASCTSNTSNSATAYGCAYVCNTEAFSITYGPNDYSYSPLNGGVLDPVTNANRLPGGNGQYQITPAFESNPRMYQQSMNGTAISPSTGTLVSGTASGGMYLGTLIQLTAQANQPVPYVVAPTNSTPGSVENVLQSNFQLQYFNVQTRARSIYNIGELGPARVIRWDAMSNGQQLKVDGVLNAQCIPEGTIAPFVQAAAMYSDTASNLNSMTMLAELYNGDTPFKRNWTGEDYDEFMRQVFPNFDLDLIIQWKQPKLIGTAMGAGIFDTFRKLASNPMVRQAAGKGLGMLASHLAGSRGQFGSAGSMVGAPQFGAHGMFAGSHGMFAGSRGQFGRARSNVSSHHGQWAHGHHRRQRSASSAGRHRSGSAKHKKHSKRASSVASSSGSHRSAKTGRFVKRRK